MSSNTTTLPRSRVSFPPPGWVLAPPWRRLAAWALDVLLFVATAGVGWSVWAVTRTWRQGTTPGKMFLGLTVFGTDTRAPADRRRMVERAVLHRGWARLLGLGSFGLGFLYVYAPVAFRSRRALYDDWARTSVLVREPAPHAPDSTPPW